jgi:putative transposase
MAAAAKQTKNERVAHIAFKTAFVPCSPQQKSRLEQAFGTARFGYNWALATWEERRGQGRKNSFEELRNQLNAVKRESFPWMADVPKDIPAEAIRDLTTAFKNFFDPKLKAQYPRRKKKGRAKFSFRLPADRLQFRDVEVDGEAVTEVRLSSLDWVRLAEPFRPVGRVVSATISRRAERHFISFCMEYEPVERLRLCKKPLSIGIDLGLTHTLTLSSGEKIESPRSLATHGERLARANRQLHRKQLGSRNRAKARARVARCHGRIADIRRDFTEKVTTRLLRHYDVVCIEDLNVGGMMRSCRFSRSLADASLGGIVLALERKARRYGCRIERVGRFFPSSKQCRVCRVENQDLTLGDRIFRCGTCGHIEDRDVHAAKGIQAEIMRKLPGATGEVTPVEQWSLPTDPRGSRGKSRRRSRKRRSRDAAMSNAGWRQNSGEPVSVADQV